MEGFLVLPTSQFIEQPISLPFLLFSLKTAASDQLDLVLGKLRDKYTSIYLEMRKGMEMRLTFHEPCSALPKPLHSSDAFPVAHLTTPSSGIQENLGLDDDDSSLLAVEASFLLDRVLISKW